MEACTMQRAAGQQGDKVRSPNAICPNSDTEVEVAERQGRRRGDQLWDGLSNILQLESDLKQLGLILRSLCKVGILQRKPPEYRTKISDKNPLKPPGDSYCSNLVTLSPMWWPQQILNLGQLEEKKELINDNKDWSSCTAGLYCAYTPLTKS